VPRVAIRVLRERSPRVLPALVVPLVGGVISVEKCPHRVVVRAMRATGARWARKVPLSSPVGLHQCTVRPVPLLHYR
jgi:hypothetical protein